MLSLPGSGTGGVQNGGGGSSVDRGDSCNLEGGVVGGGGFGKRRLLTQHNFFPNGGRDSRMMTTTVTMSTAAAAEDEDEGMIMMETAPPAPSPSPGTTTTTTTSNNTAPLLKPPVFGTPTTTPFRTFPTPTPTLPTSVVVGSSNNNKRPRDGEHHHPPTLGGNPFPPPSSAVTPLLPPPPTPPAAVATFAPVTQVKLTLESRITPDPPPPFPNHHHHHHHQLDNITSKNSGEKGQKEVDDDEDEGEDDEEDTVEDDDCDEDGGDVDSTNNNNNNHTVIDHQGSSMQMTTTTTMKSGDHGGSGSGGGGPVRNLRVRGQRKFLPEKTRHKRQTLQDMTRPLKQWLIRHKDNPYPSKAQKMDLVSKSQMTLTQVSNWFANARRRLKNTVKQPDLSWASRIKLYNSCVEGNAELFSLCSDDSCLDSDDDMMDHRQSDTFHDDVTDSLTSSRTATPDVTVGSGEACSNFNHGSSSNSSKNHSNNNHHHHHHGYHHSHSTHSNSSSNSGPSSSGPSGPHPCPGLEDTCSSFPKYKHSILHRYLSDSHQQALILDEDSVAKSRDRHHSSSTGSRDFEELSTSSVSSPAHESVHHDHLDDFSEEFETMALKRRTSDISSSSAREDMYWKEIGAALALTSLAKGRVVRI